MATVRLWNRDWQGGVNVEVRVGNMENCDQNGLYWSGNVAFNTEYPVQAENATVCYRRDAVPDEPTNPSTYGEWIRVEVFEEDIDVNL